MGILVLKECYKNQWTEFRTENEINSMFARDNMSLRQDNVKKLDPEILKKFNKNLYYYNSIIIYNLYYIININKSTIKEFI